MQNDKLVEVLSEAFGQEREEVEEMLGISLGQQLDSATTLEECHRIFKEARDRGSAGWNVRDSAERKGEKLLQKRIGEVETFEGLVHLREYIFVPHSKATRTLNKKIDGIRREKLMKLTTLEECQAFKDEFPDSNEIRVAITERVGEMFHNLLRQASTPGECDELEKRAHSLSVLSGHNREGPIRQKKIAILRQMLTSASTVEECVELQRLNADHCDHSFRREAILRAAEILRSN